VLLDCFTCHQFCAGCSRYRDAKKFSEHTQCYDCRAREPVSETSINLVLHPTRAPPLFDEDHSVGAHVSFATRMLIVIMNLLGFSMSLIVEWSGHTQHSIDRWIDRFEQTGNVLDEPRTGRPRITNETVDAAIISAAEEEKFITPRVIRDKVRVQASKRTVRRRLNEAGLFGRVARFSWPLSEEHINQRLDFATEYADWTGDNWSTVLFTDEAHIWLDNQSQIWVQRPEDTAFLDQYMVHRPPSHDKISLWAGFSALGVTQIHIITGTLDSDKLIDILAIELPRYTRRVWGSGSWNLLQDNSPIHTSEAVTEWLDSKNVRRFKFPSYSPDLNPMENVWALLKRELDHDFHANLVELHDAILDCWNNISLDILLVLVESMPRRLEAVRVQRGFKTKY
jgi:transposase